MRPSPRFDFFRADRWRTPWRWLAAGLLLAYVRGLLLDVMDVDASQYASISMEMLQNGHWLEVQHRHADYLDKPPLLFWSSAASFALFGLHNWSYKLPSFLAALLGVYATYRFARLFYPKNVARNAAFILAACIASLLLCNDLRTDTLLMAMTACTTWLVAASTVHPGARGYAYAAGAGAAAGLAMLAKGPIGLLAPLFGLGTQLLLRRDWRGIFHRRWWIAGAVLAVLLVPMCYGLYQQFDLHPEKEVNGRTGVSGLYFFFWEQSFGRITGENTWHNDASPLYFLHVYLWAFLPWPFLLAGALWQRLRALFGQKFRLPAGDEAFSAGGFVLTFIALSLSHYKLPHYIFITLPWAAVLTARWLATPGLARGWWVSQYAVLAVLVVVSFLLLGFVFPAPNPLIWAVPAGLFGYVLLDIWKAPFPADSDLLVRRSVLVFLGAALVLNFHFYPQLLTYQSTAAVPRYACAQGIPLDRLACYNRHGHALDFYAGRILPRLEDPEAVRRHAASGDFWLYTDSLGLARLDSAGVPSTTTARFGHFQVALLKPAFLNPATRPEALDPVYLLKISAQQPR